MTDLKVCRVCLCKNVKVYNYSQFNLKQYYEEILASKVNYKDGLPHYFCYMCATMLYKFHKFKEKCHTGQKTLKELLWNGPLTLTSVSQIDRDEKNLKSAIDIIYVNKKVKTCRIKYIQISESLSSDCETSLDDKNLAKIKGENIHKEAEDIINSVKEEEFDDEEECVDYKALPDSEDEDDRIFSEYELFNYESVNDEYDSVNVVKEEEHTSETADNTENKSEDTKQINNDDVKTNSENGKRKKLKKTKANNFENEKVKKFEVSSIEKNDLDPNNWLKINLNEEEAVEEFKARAKKRKYLSAAFKCNDCFKGFSKEDMLKRHIKLRHSESIGPIECRFCAMRFKWKCYLTRHITQHYTKYKCLRCDRMCPLKNTALYHNEYHNGVIRNCMHCGEEFRHLSSFYTHLRTHRSGHVCTLCGASFVSAMGLNSHKRSMHVNTVINPEEESTYCERCDIKFETRNAYEQHFSHSAMHGVEDPTNEALALSMPKSHKAVVRRIPRKFTPCTICNKIFSTYTAFKKHHKSEHKDKPIPSEKDCGRHICEICGASLAASSIASHLNTHTSKKLYTCTTCDMQFKAKSSLNRHQLTHTGEKPFECPLCDKRFTQRGSMKLHHRTIHLKEPHPKRNRRKKSSIPLELPVF